MALPVYNYVLSTWSLIKLYTSVNKCEALWQVKDTIIAHWEEMKWHNPGLD